jgi:hypothetical protein
MPEPQLPNLIVIGAMKCGTTSLHYNLGLHPEIGMSREKELNFFNRPGSLDDLIDWYRRQFPTETRWRGESSTGYTRVPFGEPVVERMHGLIPDARLVYIVRHPVDRVVSHYVHQVAIGLEQRPIDEAMADFPANEYVQRTRYCFQLSQYLRRYPASQIHVVTLEALKSAPEQTMGEIFRFLGVDDGFTSPEFTRARHKSSHKGKKNRAGLVLKRLSNTRAARLFSTDFRMRAGRLLYAPFSKQLDRPVLDASLRTELLGYLEDDIAGLEAHTGLDLSHWRR